MTEQENNMIELLYLQMYGFMFEYAYSFLASDGLAEEAIQETFRIACQKPETLAASPNPQGWIINTMKNVLSNMEKKRNVAMRGMAKYAALTQPLEAMLPDYISAEILYENLAPTEEYKMIKEMTFGGKGYAELAEERGISIEACRKRVQRAKEFLRKKINT